MIIKKYKTFKDLINDKNMSNFDSYLICISNKNYYHDIKFLVFNLFDIVRKIKDIGNFDFGEIDNIYPLARIDISNIKSLSEFFNTNDINKILATKNKIIYEINEKLKHEIFSYECAYYKNDIELLIRINCSDYLYSMFLLEKTIQEGE